MNVCISRYIIWIVYYILLYPVIWRLVTINHDIRILIEEPVQQNGKYPKMSFVAHLKIKGFRCFEKVPPDLLFSIDRCIISPQSWLEGYDLCIEVDLPKMMDEFMVAFV